MIDAIKNLGEYALARNRMKLDSPLEILIENPAANNTYKHVLIILLKNKGAEFEKIENAGYSKDRKYQYLYKKGSARGSDVTPTSRVTEIDKTFNKKILAWFNKVEEYEGDLGKDEYELIKTMGETLANNKDDILKALKEADGQIDKKKENSIVTVGVKEGGEIKYIGDFSAFQKILLKDAKINFYEKYDTSSISKDKICSVCREKKEEVYGFVNTYSFYTVDKIGLVTGGFKQEDAWKNYPVCLNCALTLEAGKTYMEENLDFKFYGFRYYLLPKIIFGKKQGEIFELIEHYKKSHKFDKESISQIRDDEERISKIVSPITNDEHEILGSLKDSKDFFNNNLLFYEKSNSAFRILLYIEDVPPSRLKKLFEAKEKVDERTIFKNTVSSKGNTLAFNFGVVRHFFPRISTNRSYDEYFLDITNKIFTNKPVEYAFLLKYIVQKIRETFVQGNSTRWNTMEGFMLLNYVNELKILKKPRGGNNMKEKESVLTELGDAKEVQMRIEKFFEEFSDFFDDNAKNGAFLEGVLTQKLLNIQYQERRATPFRSHLKGLKMNEKQVKALLPEIQNKLEEYGKNYYRDIEEITSKYLLQSGSNWRITNDEINFYFVMGMNLANHFKKKQDAVEVIENE